MGSEFRVPGFGFRDLGFGFRVPGLGRGFGETYFEREGGGRGG